jgi:hypothetical protein
MALTFKLLLNLSGHVHPHAPQAHRHTVARLLDEAKQTIVSSATMRGDCKIVAPNTPPQIVGSWEFTDDNIEA